VEPLGEFGSFQQESGRLSSTAPVSSGSLVTETSQPHLFCLFSSWVNVSFFFSHYVLSILPFLLRNLPLSFGYTASVSLASEGFVAVVMAFAVSYRPLHLTPVFRGVQVCKTSGLLMILSRLTRRGRQGPNSGLTSGFTPLRIMRYRQNLQFLKQFSIESPRTYSQHIS
jgi:hypothetical protein